MRSAGTDGDRFDFRAHLGFWHRDYLGWVVFAIGLSLAVAAVAVLESLALKYFSQYLFDGKGRVELLGLPLEIGPAAGLAFLFLVLVSAFLRYFFDMAQAHIMIKVRDAAEVRIMRNLLLRSDGREDQVSHGKLIGQLATDLPRAMSRREMIIAVVNAFVVIAAYTLFLAAHSLLLAMAILLISVFSATVNQFLARPSKEIDRIYQSRIDAVRSYVDELLRGAKEIRSNGLIERLLSRFARRLQRRQDTFMWLSRYLARLQTVNMAWPSLALGGIFALIYMLNARQPGTVEPALVAPVVMIIIQVFMQTAKAIQALVDLKLIAVSIDRLSATRAADSDLDAWSDAPETPGFRVETIELSDIHVSLAREEQERIDLHIGRLDLRPPGLVALTGPSGSGKSTLVDLLARERLPDGGQIIVNGIPVETLSRTLTSRSIKLMPQKPYLLSGPLNETLSDLVSGDTQSAADWCRKPQLRRLLDGSGLTRRLIERTGGAASATAAPEGIDRILEKALGQEVTLYGGVFSGGEQQLVGLVRCLASDAEVLLLDEPTAALDENARRTVAALLAEEAKHRLLVCSTHDARIVKCADRVLRLVDGTLEEAPPSAESGSGRDREQSR